MAPRAKRTARGGARQKEEQLAPAPEPELEAVELALSSDEEWEAGSGSDDDGSPLAVSGSDSEDDEEGAGVDRDIENAVLGYMAAAEKQRQRRGAGEASDDEPGGGDASGSDEDDDEEGGSPVVTDSDEEPAADGVAGGPSGSGSEEEHEEDDEGEAEEDERRARRAAALAAGEDPDPASDSSEEERPQRNTVGDVPLEWYRHEEHIGYNVEGQKIEKGPRRDRLDKLIAKQDSGKEFRTVYDEYNGEEIVLSKEEMRMIARIRAGQFPHVEVNPFEDEVDWFTRDVEVMPLRGGPEPKRRFIPSKWEEKKVVKLVRALRKGWIKREAPQEKPDAYLIWEDDGKTHDKTATGLTYIPAPKLKLPGHEESYNPPKEYLPTEEEKNGQQLLDDEDQPQFVPTAYDCLRRVPAYASFIKERFERCLDLYLCPRTRRKRLIIEDPEILVPKLPKPQDLQPFPVVLSLRYTGHTKPVRSLATDVSGQWLLSGSDDCTMRLWEVRTGRCMRVWQLEEPVTCVAWSPSPQLSLVAATAGKRLFLLPTGTGGEEQEAATTAALQQCLEAAGGGGSGGIEEGQLVSWQRYGGGTSSSGGKDGGGGGDGGVVVQHKFSIRQVTWHARGDYFASVAPTGNTQAVLVHQLSRGATQNPFRKNRGRVVRVLFHPTKSFFFVATQQNVRVYNLAKQALAKKLVAGSGVITSMAVHPTGDHLIVGAEDKRLCWFDLDLSTKPYRALRYHNYAVRGAAFHRSYPLFASSSDDATCHIFHGRVYADLMTNPLIVPVKILRGHDMVDFQGVLDVAFHPTQPWAFTAGADTTICLFVNP
ncbi:ribosome biogenesis BOP1-like protein [Micractinium conductrix]|uniref:Ribosome biogenesis protein BOP1 homolog n=1 Tax=Micractinium conductrix TaxID=554055 RepID=A0A2P6VQJ7_9CHLO|nr:ribosome biogenesis BOP1-like protein [Micractinium conductrix]|eukprot:PSC76374.1 ribosome biogenesis BOP1-like protein [Micractinium conductrix]